MEDTSDEENAKSPSDWVDSPLFKDDDEFETIVSTPLKSDIFSKDIGTSPNEEIERHRGYSNNRTSGGGSLTFFMEDQILRERESSGLEMTLDMDFGFEKEVCRFRDSEVNSVEVLEGTQGPLIVIGSLEKLMIFNYSSGELISDLGSRMEFSENSIRRGDPWMVDEMYYMKKHRTLFLSIKNFLGFIDISEDGENVIGNVKFKKMKDINGLEEFKRGRRSSVWYNPSDKDCLGINTRENMKTMLKIDEDSFFLEMLGFLNIQSIVSQTNATKYAVLDYSEKNFDNFHIVPNVTCVRIPPIIHPKRKDVLIIGNRLDIYQRNFRNGGTVDVTRRLKMEESNHITALGFINNDENGVLVIGTKSGEVCTFDLLRDSLKRNIVKLERQVFSILVHHRIGKKEKETTGSEYFICGSETQRGYIHLNQNRRIVRKNIKLVTKMKWCPVEGIMGDCDEPQMYFLTADRNGCVCSWRNIFYFERKDEMERCKSVLFECLDASSGGYSDDDNDDDDPYFRVFTIKILGKDIFVMKSFL